MSNENTDMNLEKMIERAVEKAVMKYIKEKEFTSRRKNNNANNTLDPTAIAMTVINSMIEMQQSQMQWDTLFRLIYAMSAATTRRRRF